MQLSIHLWLNRHSEKARHRYGRSSGADFAKLSKGQAAFEEEKVEALEMSDTKFQINFDAPAVLRKWPSIRNERVGIEDGGCPYQIAEGTLDECIGQFMRKPATQHHLYEIHTAPQGETIIPILSAKHILEIAPLRYFL